MSVGAGMGSMIHGAGQTVTTGVASAASAALPAGTNSVRLRCTADCWVNIGANVAAVATTDMFLPAGSTEVYPAAPGQFVTAIQSAAGGSLYIMPLA